MLYKLPRYLSLALLSGLIYSSSPAQASVLRHIESSHVEHQRISPLLIRRALKLAVESFDPYKIYLTREEVSPLIHLSDRKLGAMAEAVRKGDLSGFDALFALFEKASSRAKQVRSEMLSQEPAAPIALQDKFVTSSEQLKEQHRAYIAACAQASGYENAPWNQIVNYYNKRLSFHEQGYTRSHWKTRATKAIARSFDPHTAYYTPDETAHLRVLLENGYRGVGIGFSETLTGIYASTLTPKGPAERSGRIEAGDRLIAIEETSVEQLCFPDVMNRLRQAQSPVRLNFSNEKGEYSVLLDKVALEAKEGRLAASYEPTEGGIFVKLSLPSFYESDQMSAAHDIRFALRNLARQGNIQGVVLDLRENPGGFLTEGVRVAGTFMHSGIVARAACRGAREQFLRDLSCQQFYKGPLVVLVSKASASCSEIVAGALQDYGLAVVVGDAHTFGKATIQDQTMSTSRTSSYRVTMGRYTTVSGRSPQIEGVVSDIVVPTHYHNARIGERYLAYPLAGAHGSPLFKDPLSDVHPSKRSWLRSRYLPSIQKREIIWDGQMEKLRAQSSDRLASSEAYQAFLENPASAREDLVMREAIEILKDMNRILSGNS